MGGVTYYDDDDADIWLYYTYDEPSHVTRARWEAEAKGLKFVAEAVSPGQTHEVDLLLATPPVLVPVEIDHIIEPAKKRGGWPRGKPRKRAPE